MLAEHCGALPNLMAAPAAPAGCAPCSPLAAPAAPLNVPLPLPLSAAGDVPLHFAAIHGHPMCAYNIAKACPATVLLRNNRQQTPVEVAVACERGEVSQQGLLMWQGTADVAGYC